MKTNKITFRASDEERERLSKAAIEKGFHFKSRKDKANVSDYIRFLVINDQNADIPKEIVDELIAALRDLGRKGSNLNQINRYLGLRLSASEDGFHRAVDSKVDDIEATVKDMHSAFGDVRSSMKRILNILEGRNE